MSEIACAAMLAILLSGCRGSISPSTTDQPGETPGLPTAPTATRIETNNAVETPEVFTNIAATPTEEDPWRNVDVQGQTVYFWYYAEPLSDSDRAINQIVDRFNENNAYQIRVEAYNLSSANAVLEQLRPLLHHEGTPGLILVDPESVAELVGIEGLTELSSLINSTMWGLPLEQKEIGSLEATRTTQAPSISGGVYALPTGINMQFVLYNLDWLVETGSFSAPGTLQELTDLSCKGAQIGYTKSPTANWQGLEIEGGIESFATLTEAFGGEIHKSESPRYVFNSPEAHEAMKFLQNMAINGCLKVLETNLGSIERFVRGETLFLYSDGRSLAKVENALGTGGKFHWDITQFPSTNGPGVTSGRVENGIAIPISSQQQTLAAWLFLREFTGKKGHGLWLGAAGEAPIYESSLENLSAPLAYAKIAGWVQKTELLPTNPGFTKINELVRETMVRITEGEEVEELLENLQIQAEIISNE